MEADSSLERVQMYEAYTNYCFFWPRKREGYGGSSLHFKVYGTKEPYVSSEPERMPRKVAVLELPSKGHAQVVALQSQVTLTERIGTRVNQRGQLLCQGTML